MTQTSLAKFRLITKINYDINVSVTAVACGDQNSWVCDGFAAKPRPF